MRCFVLTAIAAVALLGAATSDVCGQSVLDQLQAGAREGLDRVLAPAADDQKPYLGIRGDDDPRGVQVLSVRTGGSADAAGILPGDVITAVQGRPTRSMDALANVLQTRKPGDQIPVQLLRDGRSITLQVTLGSFANPAPPAATDAAAAEPEASTGAFPLPPPRKRPPSPAGTPPPPLPGDQLDPAPDSPPMTAPESSAEPPVSDRGRQPPAARRPGPLLQRVGPLLDRVAPLIDGAVTPGGAAGIAADPASEMATLRRQVTTLQAEVDALKRRLAELEARLEAGP